MIRITLENLERDLQESIADLSRDPVRVKKSRAVVEKALLDGKPYYGINTGFGILANKRIPEDKLEELQQNIILSHSVGVGELVPRDISRLMLLLKIHGLGLGYSGISMGVLNRLIDFAKLDLIPAVPSKGSLGASGDLAPLSHLALPLLGMGSFWSGEGGAVTEARKLLKKHGLSPVKLQAKDGLALCNGTQLMSAYGSHVLSRSAPLLKCADIIGAMSLEGLRGSLQPFDERVHLSRPYRGQLAVAANIRSILKGSEIVESHRNCDRVQDPYSIRCMPQVHGASRDALRHATEVFETEINSATDNPLVFEDGTIISAGNFHGQPLALAMDYAAIALSEIASISERRIFLLLSGSDNLPRLLMKDTGVNSGFMIPQYTAAALVSENKVLSHPASVDSIPSCLGQEDHVSMGAISATKLLQVFRNVQEVLAIELFTAAQALDYQKPLRAGPGVEAAHQMIRSVVPHFERDQHFRGEIDKCRTALENGGLLRAVTAVTGDLA